MPYSENKLKSAKTRRDRLQSLLKQRSILEKDWKTIIQPTDLNFPDITSHTVLDYSIIISDLSEIKYCMTHGATLSKRSIELALKANDKNVLEYIESFKSSENILNTKQILPPTIIDNDFTTQLLAGDLAAVKSSIKKGATLELKNPKHLGASSLMCAISSNNKELIEFVIHHSKSLKDVDFMNRTAMHALAFCNDKEICSLLFSIPELQSIAQYKDKYDRNALYIAINNGNNVFIDEYEKTFNVTVSRTKSIDIHNISQNHLIKQLRYYLLLENHNPETIYTRGMCNGFAFLECYYSSIHKEKEFFDIRQMISSWKGDYESLRSLSKLTKECSENYKENGDLFRQFANDLIWFQSTLDITKIQSLVPKQQSRMQQYQIVKNKHDDKELQFNTLFELKINFSIGQFAELINLITKHNNTQIDIGYLNHTTSVYKNKDGTFSYNDSNDHSRLASFKTSWDLGVHIKQIGYALDSSNETDKQKKLNKMLFNVLTPKPLSPDFCYFSTQELEELGKIEVLGSYYNNSKNRLTPIHIAVLFNSFSNVLFFLKSTLGGGLNTKCAHIYTPVELALFNNRIDILNEMIQSKYFDLNKHNILLYVYKKTQIINANQMAYQAMFKKLMDMPFNNSNGFLNYLVSLNELDLVRVLLKKGVNPDENSAKLSNIKYTSPILTAMNNSPTCGTGMIELLLCNMDTNKNHKKIALKARDAAAALDLQEIVTILEKKLQPNQKKNFSFFEQGNSSFESETAPKTTPKFE